MSSSSFSALSRRGGKVALSGGGGCAASSSLLCAKKNATRTTPRGRRRSNDDDAIFGSKTSSSSSSSSSGWRFGSVVVVDFRGERRRGGRRRKNRKERRGVFEATRREEEDENELVDPDEIAFLTSRDGERYDVSEHNNNNNSKESSSSSSSSSSSWRRATSVNGTSTSSSINNGVEKKTNDDSDDDFRRNEEDSNDELMMKEQSPFGIRERFGRLLINTFGKKWDSKPASLKGLEKRDVPRHIAIIMDGNARWAERRRLPPRVGHENGVESLRAVVKCASAWGIKVISVYTFSIENWSRGPPEVEGLLDLLETTLREDAENLMRNDVKVVVMGDLSRVKPSLRQAVEETVEMTKDNQGVVLNVALSYGGRQDIVNAAKDMAEAVKFGSLRIEDISQETFMRYLGTTNVLKEGEEEEEEEEEEEVYESFDQISKRNDDSLGDYAGVDERYMGGQNVSLSSSSSQQEKGNVSSLRAARSLQNPDLLIRTSGEQRLSNFMLFEMAYTELYFTETMWPEFGEAELRRAIFAYAKRDRRFGSRAAKESASNTNDDSTETRGRGPPGGFSNSSGVRTTTTSGSTAAGAATGAAASSGSIIGNNNNNNKNNAGGGTRSQQPSSGSINALTLGGESNVLNSSKNSDIPPSQE